MTYEYEIETRNGTTEYEIEPTYSEVKSAIIQILSTKTTKEIYSIMEEIAYDKPDLEEYFYDELKEYFEDKAREKYKESEQKEKDLYYDYYQDKL